MNTFESDNEIRKNWGYWAGRDDAERGREFKPAGILRPSDETHFDPVYEAGYREGFAAGQAGT
jgi:hypothetical protein